MDAAAERGHGRARVLAQQDPVGPQLLLPQGMVAAWEGACGTLDQYGMQYTRTFANLCNAGAHPDSLAAVLRGACAVQGTLVSPLAQQVAST